MSSGRPHRHVRATRSGKRAATAAVESWLARYGAAWRARDPDAAAALFAPGARYHETPYAEPFEGTTAIHDYWRRVTADQRDVRFEARTIAVAGDTAVAHWAAQFRLESNGAHVGLDGVFVLVFDGAGLCTSLREWWHAR